MGMTNQMKEKMMKVIIDGGGHIEFITPKGEKIPSIVGAEIEWNYADGGLITAKVTFHAYMDNKK